MTVTLAQLEKHSEGQYEPWQSDKWKVLALPTIGGLKLPIELIEAVTPPFNVLQERAKNIASSEIYFANGTRPGQFSMEAASTARLHALRYFDTWQQMIQNPYTGGFRLPSTYKKNISCALYDPTGQLVVTIEVRNCWPASYDGLALARQSSNEPLVVQFKCDACRLIWST